MLASVVVHLFAQQITSRLIVGYATLTGCAVIEAGPAGLARVEYRQLWESWAWRWNVRMSAVIL